MRPRVRKLIAAVVLAAGTVLAGPFDGGVLASPPADDGRVGVVTDLQGTLLVRPAGRTRWSPAGPRSVLLPGDEVRTLVRGANAAEIRLEGGGALVVGPG